MDITPKLEKQARTLAVKIKHFEGQPGAEYYINTGGRELKLGTYVVSFQDFASLVSTTKYLLDFADEIISVVHNNIATKGL